MTDNGYMLFGPLSQLAENKPSPTNTVLTTPSNTTTSDGVNNSNPVIPPYLWENIDLWVWDWDDTLIDTSAYIQHSMSRPSIMNLSDRELGEDVPYWQFFRDLVVYLVQNGRRVGIASFGTYTIIRAYMDRIFGRDQKYFIRANIHAACEDLDCVRDYRQMPLNKNPYIQRLMNHYRITDHQRVILFDDAPSNIADAKRLGVVSVQMGVYDTENAKWLPPQKAGMAGLFGPSTLIQFGDRFAQKCSKSDRVGSSQVFGWIGDRKSWKYQTQADNDDTNRVLNPNFRTSHFTNTKKDNLAYQPESYARISENQTPNQTPKINIETRKKERKSGKLITTQATKEGMRNPNSPGSCLSCQDPMSNYLLLGIFMLLVLLIIWFVKWG
jgi:FMN phosphatase YigB (HAD superfamily)